MGIRQNVSKLSQQWHKAHIDNKILNSLYFLLFLIFSPGILSILLPLQNQTSISVSALNGITNIIFSTQIETITQIAIVIYWICLFSFLILGFKTKKRLAMLLICWVVVIIDLMANFITYFLLKAINQRISYTLEVLSILTILSTFFITFIHNKIFIGLGSNPNNKLSHRYYFLVILNKLLQNTIFAVHLSITLFAQPTQWQPHMYNIGLVLIYIWRLWLLARKRYYLQKAAHFSHVLVTLCSLVLVAFTQVESIFLTKLLENSFFIIVILITIFAMTAFYQFYEHKQIFCHQKRISHVLLTEIQQIMSSNEVIFYLDSLGQLYANRLKNEHEFLIAAYCKIYATKQQVKQQGNYLVDSNPQEAKQETNIKRVIKKFQNHVKNVLNCILLHTTDQQVLNECLYLKTVLFQQVFSVNTFLQGLHLKFNSFHFKLSSSLISNQMKSIIKAQNHKIQIKIDPQPIINIQSRLKSMYQIIKKDLRLKSQKWKQLCNNFCKNQQIHQSISQQIDNLTQFNKIYQQNNQNYNKSLQFLLMALFYYGCVIFHAKKCQQINKNLKIVKTSQNSAKLITNQQKIIASLYQKSFCFLQLNINQNLNGKTKLTIKNSNKNPQKIFNCSDNKKLLGKCILDYFPAFLGQSFENLIQNEIKQNKGKVHKTYLVDEQKKVFEALISFRIILVGDNISCLVLIQKTQSDNLIILDFEGFIEHIGSHYLNLFTAYKFHRLHFSSLLRHPSQYKSLELNFCQQGNTYLRNIQIINISQDKQSWFNQLDRIQKWSNPKSKQKSKFNLSDLILNISQSNESHKGPFNFDQYVKFVQKIRQSENDKSPKNLTFQENEELSSNQTSQISNFLNIEVSYKKQKLKQNAFYVLQLRKIQQSNLKRYQNYDFVNQKGKNQNVGSQKLKNTQNIKVGVDETFQKDEIQSEDFSFESQDNQKNLFYRQSSTNNSNSLNCVFSRPLMSFSEKILAHPQKFRDKKLIRFTVISLILCVLIGLMILTGYLILSNYLKELRQIFEIDCAVSDSFQLSQLMYNNAITYEIFRKDLQQSWNQNDTNEVKNHIEQLKIIRRSYFQQRQLLMSLLSQHQAKFDEKLTVMTGTPYFGYLHTEVLWKTFPNQSSLNLDKNWQTMTQNQIQIVLSEMFMLYDAHSRAVINNILIIEKDNTIEWKQKDIQIERSLGLMKINFPQLKRLNHFNIQYYSQLTQKTSFFTNILAYMFCSIHVILVIVMLLLTFLDKKYREQQSNGMVQLYGVLQKQTILQAYSYFSGLKQTLLQLESSQRKNSYNHSSLSNYHIFSQIIENSHKPNETYDVLNLKSQKSNGKNNFSMDQHQKSTFSRKLSYSSIKFSRIPPKNRFLLSMLLIGIIVNFLFIYGVYKISILNITVEQVILGIGELMNAQNYLLQSYFDLKANFVTLNPRNDQKFFNQLLQHQQSIDVIFNKIALSTLQVFTQYDPQYSESFVDLLRSDVCLTIRNQISQAQFLQCDDKNKMQYFSDGIAVTMNFLTRKIFETILQVKAEMKKSANNFKFIDKLKQAEHRDINQYLFYIFKAFQELQKRVGDQLQKISQITIVQCQRYIIIQTIIILVICPILMVYNCNKLKEQILRLYLSLLLLNEELVGDTKRIMQKATILLQFEQESLSL